MGNLAYAGKSALWGWRDLEAMDPKKTKFKVFAVDAFCQQTSLLHCMHRISRYIWYIYIWEDSSSKISCKPGLHGVESQGNYERCSTPLPVHLLTCIRPVKDRQWWISTSKACSYIQIRQALDSYHERGIVPNWFQHCLQPHGDRGSKNIGGNSVLTYLPAVKVYI